MGQKNSTYVDDVQPEARQDILFTSLGVVVLDELLFFSQKRLVDIIGGSGAYSTLGARLFSPQPRNSSVGWMVRAGDDFPQEIEEKLRAWNTRLFLVKEPGQLTTRGRLEYEDEFHHRKNFRYLTPVLKILPIHFEDTYELLSSQSFHLLADPMEDIGQIDSLLALREDARINDKPLLIWEPRPSSCIPTNLQDFFQAVQKVDVFTPNHVELAGVFGHPNSEPPSRATVETFALKFLGSDVGGQRTVVIRAGEEGCFIADDQTREWLPAYHEPTIVEGIVTGSSAKVIDHTGAGNAFIGAFAIGYLSTSSIHDAACYGNVGASFALEQIGPPDLSQSEDGEHWNGADPLLRLKEYRSRLKRSNSSAEY